MIVKTVGSVCSGIEAASVAWNSCDFDFVWFSETAEFPSKVLKNHYPLIPNLGDMNNIPQMLYDRKISSPDLICGGTPCQAFSLAGWKSGLLDERGNLTIRFIDIVNANDEVRMSNGKEQSIVFWENVEGVLTDKTNAFGCFISLLSGLDNILIKKKWPNAGLIRGPKRNVAWRVLDAKYFGLPQQRKRIYLLAGGKNFYPENVLFEKHENELAQYPTSSLSFKKEGHRFEIFREYTDCLYSAYGTKWNGNAAANNGSLFIVQDNRIRRLSPLECERLMGFPDNYTYIDNATKTSRYQVIGNSWAVPVVKWIGNRLVKFQNIPESLLQVSCTNKNTDFWECDDGFIDVPCGLFNCSSIPEKCIFSSLNSIVSPEAPESIYISPVGCYGIVRRANERNISINPRLKEVLLSISEKMSPDEIERKSRVQKRGRYSDSSVSIEMVSSIEQLTFFNENIL